MIKGKMIKCNENLIKKNKLKKKRIFTFFIELKKKIYICLVKKKVIKCNKKKSKKKDYKCFLLLKNDWSSKKEILKIFKCGVIL